MVVVYEVLFLIFLITVVVFCGRPLVEAYSDKIRGRYKEIESGQSPERARALEQRIEMLEGEVIELRQQLRAVQESAEFALSLGQGTGSNESQETLLTQVKSNQ